MLTIIFVKGTGESMIDRVKELIGEYVDATFHVADLAEASQIEVTTPFYLILYNDEFLSPVIARGILNMIEYDHWDAVVLFRKTYSNKKDYKLSRSFRLFRKGIQIDGASLVPAKEGVRVDRLLDGFIFGSDYPYKDSKRISSGIDLSKQEQPDLVKQLEELMNKAREENGHTEIPN